jgi:hypothetical protein
MNGGKCCYEPSFSLYCSEFSCFRSMFTTCETSYFQHVFYCCPLFSTESNIVYNLKFSSVNNLITLIHSCYHFINWNVSNLNSYHSSNEFIFRRVVKSIVQNWVKVFCMFSTIWSARQVLYLYQNMRIIVMVTTCFQLFVYIILF